MPEPQELWPRKSLYGCFRCRILHTSAPLKAWFYDEPQLEVFLEGEKEEMKASSASQWI